MVEANPVLIHTKAAMNDDKMAEWGIRAAA